MVRKQGFNVIAIFHFRRVKIALTEIVINLLSGKYYIASKAFRVLTFLFLLVCSICSKAQTEDYKLSSSDGEFAMEVSRENKAVKVSLHFTEARKYSHLFIEKSDDLKSEFRQCAYIDLREDAKSDGLVEKKDEYPRIYSASYYRIRTVTTEGIERTYPAVRLPAKTL